jgi:hypothetical protein
MPLDYTNRRKYPRLEGVFKADLLNLGDDPGIANWEAIVPATALDVSREGMRLQVDYNVALQSTISVIVYYKGRDSVCLSKVMWKREEMGQATYGLFIKEWSKLDPVLNQELKTLEESEKKKSIEMK